MARRALALAVVAAILGACADEGGPSFAPDAASETAASALTPSPSSTPEVVDRQPGERPATERTLAELAAGRGSTVSVVTREGDSLILHDTATGATRRLRLPAGTETVAASNDGGTVVALRRVEDRLLLEALTADGASVGSVVLSPPLPGTPVASPVGSPSATDSGEALTRDRMEISPDGRHVVVVSREGDLTIATLDPALSIVRVIQDFGDVSTLGWTADSALALVATYDRSRSTGNLTGVPLTGRLRSILRLPASDGRRIISVSAPAGSADVFYVARSEVDDWSAQNNLYRIPLVGGLPTVVLATGLAGPAGAVDRFAVTDDGRTVAASILIPRGEDLSFHSLWVSDVETARPLEVDTGALGLISRLAWTPDGLFLIGVQRERSDEASRLVTVSMRLDAEGELHELERQESPATPIGSPIPSQEMATPAAATPIASPIA